jgi:hypothetical protein
MHMSPATVELICLIVGYVWFGILISHWFDDDIGKDRNKNRDYHT